MASILGGLLISGGLTHQENYARQFHQDSRCRLVALTDEATASTDRVALNKTLAQSLNIPYLPDLNEALQRDDVDFVSVCAEPERRGRILVQAAKAGKHLYIDKPMTPYLSIADEIVQAVDEADIRSQMFSFIHQPWAQRARQIIESGQIGDLLAIHADCLFAKGPAGTANPIRLRRPTFPPEHFTFVDAKAEMYAMGIYALGLVCWLSQKAVKTVYSRTANYFFAAHQGHDVEDFGFLMLTLEGDLTATVTGGRVGWTSHPSGGTNQVYLIGSQGAMLVDAYHPRLEVYDTAAPWTAPSIHPNDPMGFWSSTQAEVGTQPKRTFVPLLEASPAKSDESHFLDCILEGRESPMNVHQTAKLTEILLAGYKSASIGEVVSLPLSRAEFSSKS